MIVLGINAFHADSAAALLRDGRLTGAVEEERFRRVKHWAGFPARSIAWCLRDAGITLSDVDCVAVNTDTAANATGRLRHMLSHAPRPSLWRARLRQRAATASIAELLAQACPGQIFRGRVHPVEHHAAHLASAFYVSPFRRAAVVSVDGFGDFASAAWGTGDGDAFAVDGRILFPHSLGIFYQALTQYLGFTNYGDEYKVMGLAPYGAPRFVNELHQVLRHGSDGHYALNLDYFRHHRDAIASQGEGAPEFADLFSPALETLLGPRRAPHEELTHRHRDIAHSVQAAYEDALFTLLNDIQGRSGLTELALAGGCALNSMANGKITRRTPFRSVYVPPAPGDAGGALGAALAVWHRQGGIRGEVMDRAGWGPQFSADDIARAIAGYAVPLRGFTVDTMAGEQALCARVAQAIADGKVVGWFQGGAEWGPRALGHRSILADPRRADMKDILNSKIKHREAFRPFAPSVVEEAARDWFDGDASVPFMEQVLPVRTDKRPLIPAVTHIDGSARPQTVSRTAYPRFWALIEAFAALTGVPLLLNTSFNENEPIVRSPQEALDCFLRTEMDLLVLGDVVIARDRSIATSP